MRSRPYRVRIGAYLGQFIIRINQKYTWKEEGIVKRKSIVKYGAIVIALMIITTMVYGQNGSAGITNATNKVKEYFNIAINLVYAIGAVIGLVGAIKVYSKWSNGEPDTSKVASSWFGACIFLVVVATILQGFFGV